MSDTHLQGKTLHLNTVTKYINYIYKTKAGWTCAEAEEKQQCVWYERICVHYERSQHYQTLDLERLYVIANVNGGFVQECSGNGMQWIDKNNVIS